MFSTLKYDPETNEVQQLRSAFDPVTARSNQHQACNTCHAKKLRCSGERDGCERCVASQILCEYTRPNSRSSRRGRKTTGAADENPHHRPPSASPPTSQTTSWLGGQELQQHQYHPHQLQHQHAGPANCLPLHLSPCHGGDGLVMAPDVSHLPPLSDPAAAMGLKAETYADGSTWQPYPQQTPYDSIDPMYLNTMANQDYFAMYPDYTQYQQQQQDHGNPQQWMDGG